MYGSTDSAAIVDALATVGWSITPDLVSGAPYERLVEAVGRLWEEGGFRRAGIGAGTASLRSEIRSDHIHWLDPAALPEAVIPYWEWIAALQQEINQTLYLGLRGFEAHFAVYPAGAFYKPHLDQFRTAPHRMVSCILYLNEGWTYEDGGILRIYPPDDTDAAPIEVVPEAGTFVCFLSDRILHEVLPARRQRYSLTGWLHREKV